MPDPEIIQLERFLYDGKEYSTLITIRRTVENKIGAIIDKMDLDGCGGGTAKQRVAVMTSLIENREELIGLLSTYRTYHDPEDGCMSTGKKISVFDS